MMYFTHPAGAPQGMDVFVGMGGTYRMTPGNRLVVIKQLACTKASGLVW